MGQIAECLRPPTSQCMDGKREKLFRYMEDKMKFGCDAEAHRRFSECGYNWVTLWSLMFACMTVRVDISGTHDLA